MKKASKILIAAAIAALAAVSAFLIVRGLNQRSAEDCSEITEENADFCRQDAEPEPEPEPAKPALINLQPTVDAWAASLSSGTAGVVIYDLDNEAVVATLNATTKFPTESLYKLFVVYEGYRRIERGSLDANATISSGRSWAKCLDLAIRESNSPCAEAMRAALGASNLNSIIKSDYNIQHTDVAGLTSTPEDIADMMKLYYYHPEFSAATWATIQDTMLNQPPSAGLCKGPCDWRRGLPTGFVSGEAKVYNKVGWYSAGNGLWKSYHDAAIVEFPNLDRHYIVVVMTRNSYLKDVVRLGTEIEKTILNS